MMVTVGTLGPASLEGITKLPAAGCVWWGTGKGMDCKRSSG